MKDQPKIFESTIQKTDEIIKAINDRFGWADMQRAYQALRAVLHALRDRLTVDAAVALGAQLPMLARGFYYESWKPMDTPKKMNKEEFVGEVERQIDPLSYPESTEEMIKGVLAVVESYIDPDEMRKVKNLLPKEIHEMLG